MMEGDSFGRYRILEELGRGGMGVVHRAQDPSLGRSVAIKVLLGTDPEEVARFEREARAAAALRHANIVPVHDIGVEDGRPYYTMDLVEGPSLARVVNEMGKLPPRAAARIARDVARALEAAHAKGIVHRDVKPQNILMSPESSAREEKPAYDTSLRLGGGFTETYRVLLTDFGLARNIDATKKLTVTGTVVGTPAYMSPEQAQGGEVDARTDVYSLGAVLYEMLGGRAPFEASDVYKLLLQVIHDEPPPLAPGLSEDLRTIAQKAMAKERGRRYSSAREFADDLDRYLGGEAISARPASFWYRLRKRAARHRGATAGIAVAGLGGVLALAYFLGPAWVEGHDNTRVVWPSGRHTLRFEGFDPVEVNTRPWSHHEVTNQLVPDHGWVEVSSDPPGADVAVIFDGETVALSRAGERIRVRKGTHHIRLWMTDFKDYDTGLYVPPGEVASLAVRLDPKVGYMTVTTYPSGVVMMATHLGTQDVSRNIGAPFERIAFPVGRYKLRFERDGYCPVEREVAILPSSSDETRNKNQPSERGLLWIQEPGVAYLHITLRPVDQVAPSTWSRITLGTTSLCDIDGDGSFELIGSYGDGHVFALCGQDGAMIWAWKADAGISSHGTTFISPMGPMCLVGCSNGKMIALSAKAPEQVWSSQLSGAALWHARLGDANADGIDDFVIGTAHSSVSFLISQILAISGRDGSVLWNSDGLASMQWARGPALGLGDLDGDGCQDVVLRETGGKGIRAISGRRGSTLWLCDLDPASKLPFGWTAVHDIDGDRAPDVLVLKGDRIWALRGRDGQVLWEFKSGIKWTQAPSFADLNHDGSPDFLLPGSDETSAKLAAYSGRGGSLLWEESFSVAKWVSLSMVDVNGDGVADCIAVSSDGKVFALWGQTGSRLWSTSCPSPVQAPVLTADLNGDAYPDIVASCEGGLIVALSGYDGTQIWISRVVPPPLRR